MTVSLESYDANQTANYKELPKNIGEVSSAVLLGIARQYASQAEQLSERTAAKLHAVAGSAYVESVLTENSMRVDVRLACLEKAEHHLRAAADGERLLIEGAFYDLDDQTEWLRAELNYDFMDVYRDIACGEVTDLTTVEIIEKLHRRKHYLAKAGAKEEDEIHTDERAINGLSNELVVLLKTWEDYEKDGTTIAFPSTVRGGSGEYQPGQTHDIVFAWQDSEDGWEFSGAEVKSGSGRTVHALTRYKNKLIFVDRDGKIRIFEPVVA